MLASVQVHADVMQMLHHVGLTVVWIQFCYIRASAKAHFTDFDCELWRSREASERLKTSGPFSMCDLIILLL